MISGISWVLLGVRYHCCTFRSHTVLYVSQALLWDLHLPAFYHGPTAFLPGVLCFWVSLPLLFSPGSSPAACLEFTILGGTNSHLSGAYHSLPFRYLTCYLPVPPGRLLGGMGD